MPTFFGQSNVAAGLKTAGHDAGAAVETAGRTVKAAMVCATVAVAIAAVSASNVAAGMKCGGQTLISINGGTAGVHAGAKTPAGGFDIVRSIQQKRSVPIYVPSVPPAAMNLVGPYNGTITPPYTSGYTFNIPAGIYTAAAFLVRSETQHGTRAIQHIIAYNHPPSELIIGLAQGVQFQSGGRRTERIPIFSSFALAFINGLAGSGASGTFLVSSYGAPTGKQDLIEAFDLMLYTSGATSIADGGYVSAGLKNSSGGDTGAFVDAGVVSPHARFIPSSAPTSIAALGSSDVSASMKVSGASFGMFESAPSNVRIAMKAMTLIPPGPGHYPVSRFPHFRDSSNVKSALKVGSGVTLLGLRGASGVSAGLKVSGTTVVTGAGVEYSGVKAALKVGGCTMNNQVFTVEDLITACRLKVQTTLTELNVIPESLTDALFGEEDANVGDILNRYQPPYMVLNAGEPRPDEDTAIFSYAQWVPIEFIYIGVATMNGLTDDTQRIRRRLDVLAQAFWTDYHLYNGSTNPNDYTVNEQRVIHTPMARTNEVQQMFARNGLPNVICMIHTIDFRIIQDYPLCG